MNGDYIYFKVVNSDQLSWRPHARCTPEEYIPLKRGILYKSRRPGFSPLEGAIHILTNAEILLETRGDLSKGVELL